MDNMSGLFQYTPALFAGFVLPFLLWSGSFYSLAGVLLFFPVMPALDFAFGRQKPKQNSTAAIARLVPYLYVPIHITLVLGGIWIIATKNFNALEVITIAISTGIFTGAIGITYAHELGHRNSRWEVFLAYLLLGLVSYGHFLVAHNKIHHKWVATPRDPASARRGTGLYYFILQSIILNFWQAFVYEHERKSLYQNSVFKVTCFSITIGTLAFVWSPWAGLFFVLQSVAAIFLLETVNYVQHYGLRRKVNGGGGYEKLSPYHSWNTNIAANNLVLLQLGSHSAHHLKAKVPFYELHTNKRLPMQPYGYAGMILLAMLPPIWYRVMHARLDALP